MNFLSNEFLRLYLAINDLTYHLNQILAQGSFRTISVYYENRTSFVTATIIRKIASYENITTAYATFNLDLINKSAPIIDDIMGNAIFNICILDNIVDTKYLDMDDHVLFDPRENNIYLSSTSASDDEIRVFFKNIWRNAVLNVGLIFWMEGVQIYTFSPYQQIFCRKIFDTVDIKGAPVPLPSGVFDILFANRANDLGNTSYKVFLSTDPPKVYRTPARFQFGAKYHFGGRDGLFAHSAEKILNGHWQYQTLAKDFGIINFEESGPQLATQNVDIINISGVFSWK